MDVTITIDEKELHRVYRQFNTLTNYKSQVRVMSSARAAGARVIARTAKKTSAFKDRSGRLRKSIVAKKARPFRKGFWFIQAGGKIKSGGYAGHAYIVEHGHKGAAPHPFFMPAAKAASNEAFKQSGRAFWKATQRELNKGN